MYSLLLILLLISAVSSELVPQTINLTGRPSPRHARRNVHHARHTNGMSEPLQDDFYGTDLKWFGEIGVGTPPQFFDVVFDTAELAMAVAVPGVQCGRSCTNQHKFDFNASSTFVLDITAVPEIGQATIPIGVDLNHTGTFKFLSGFDTVTLLGITVPNVSVVLITYQTAGLSDKPYDGFFGLAPNPGQGIFAALTQSGYPALFSMFLTPNAVGQAELTLGGIDHSKLNGHDPIWAPIIVPPYEWALDPAHLTVNGQAVEQNLFAGQAMIFDSGINNLVMPLNLTLAMYALISPEIKPSGTLGAFGIPCSEISSIPAEITFTFTSSSGSLFNLTIPSDELNVGPLKGDPNTCQTLISAFDFPGLGIIGGSLLKHYTSIYDADNAKMGFVKNGF